MTCTNYLIIGLTIVTVVASWYAYRTYEANELLHAEVIAYGDDQVLSVLEAADVLRQTNAVEPSFSGIITDCTPEDRIELDSLLSRLSSLSSAQLVTLQSLYSECGAYFSQQRALKTYQLSLEAEQLLSYYEAHTGVSDETIQRQMDAVAALVSLEQANVTLSQQLVSLQGEIIAALQQGAAPESDEVLQLLGAAQEARENLQFNTQEARDLRSQLSP